MKVWTDHKNLEYFSTARTTSRRHARWAATLAGYNYVISYRKGAGNGKADALSRNPSFVSPPLPSLPILNPAVPTPPNLRGAAITLLPDDPLLPAIVAAQAEDATTSASIEGVQRGPGGESNPALPGGRPSGRSARYRMQGGIVYHGGRVVVPPSATDLILRILPTMTLPWRATTA